MPKGNSGIKRSGNGAPKSEWGSEIKVATFHGKGQIYGKEKGIEETPEQVTESVIHVSKKVPNGWKSASGAYSSIPGYVRVQNGKSIMSGEYRATYVTLGAAKSAGIINQREYSVLKEKQDKNAKSIRNMKV